MLKVDDENQPADFLTKWIGKAKLDASAEFAENARARRPLPAPPDVPSDGANECAAFDNEWAIVPKHRRAKGQRVVRVHSRAP